MTRFGFVLVFPAGFSKLEVRRAIEGMKERGLLDRDPEVEEFDDEVEGPVWYIP